VVDRRSAAGPATFTSDLGQFFPTNFAWSVVHQDEWYAYKRDLYAGALAFLQAVAAYHGAPLSRGDVLLFSRPDVLYSHTIDFGPLQALGVRYAARDNDFVLLVRHTQAFGGHDPSDVFFVGTYGFMNSTWGRHAVIRNPKGLPEVPDRAPDSAFPGVQGWLLHQPACRGNHVFFMSNELQLHLHRMDGGHETAINGPGAPWVQPGQAIAHGPLDLTAHAICAVGREELCEELCVGHGRGHRSHFDVHALEKVQLYNWSRGLDHFYTCRRSRVAGPCAFAPLTAGGVRMITSSHTGTRVAIAVATVECIVDAASAGL